MAAPTNPHRRGGRRDWCSGGMAAETFSQNGGGGCTSGAQKNVLAWGYLPFHLSGGCVRIMGAGMLPMAES